MNAVPRQGFSRRPLWLTSPAGELQGQLLAGEWDGQPFRLVLLPLAQPPLDRLLAESRLRGQMLSATEESSLAGLHYPKRRREWLGGRIAAKAAVHLALCRQPLQEGAQPAWPTITVRAAASGKPEIRLAAAGQPPPFLSLSHSHGKAAAMAAALPCGLDLQAYHPTILKIGSRFAHPDEQLLLANGAGDHRAPRQLTMLWSAKEAIRKLIGHSPLPGFREMRLVGVHPLPGTGEWQLLRVTVQRGFPSPLAFTAQVAVQCGLRRALAISCCSSPPGGTSGS